MGYGHLSLKQVEVLRPHVDGRVVTDLGAGACELSEMLLEMRASEVVAVDRTLPRTPPREGIRLVKSYFHDFRDPVDVALLSWPVNWPVGLVPSLERARLVIYLGSNVRGNACGSEDLWEHLRRREIVAHEPEDPNTLTVYGPGRVVRRPTGEEIAAGCRERIMTFEEAEEAAKR